MDIPELLAMLAAERAQNAALTAQVAALMGSVVELTAAVGRLTKPSAPVSSALGLTCGELWDLYVKTFHDEKWGASVRALMKAPMAHFVDVPVADVRRSTWAFYRDHVSRKRITRQGSTPSVKTRNDELVRFKVMLNWGTDQELIPSNPLARMKKERNRPARETVIGDRDLEVLLSKSSVLLRAFILIAIDSGMRRDEVRTLRWEQVENSGRVKVSWTVAKAKRSRSVRLSERALDAIDELPRVAFSRYVFANPNTNEPYGKSYFWELFRGACSDAKLQAAEGDGNVHYHDTRHTNITRTIQNGTPMVVAMRAAGHVTLSQAQRYMHVDETDLDLMKARNDEAIKAGPRKSPQRQRPNRVDPIATNNSEG